MKQDNFNFEIVKSHLLIGMFLALLCMVYIYSENQLNDILNSNPLLIFNKLVTRIFKCQMSAIKVHV